MLLLLLLFVAYANATKLTAHLIPHSHCDPGWLSTFEGYFQDSVNNILTNVMRALEKEPYRKFVWSETSFWMRWYEIQDEEMRNLVQRFLLEKRLEFVGGGWVQNDEANPDFNAVYSQFTEGHEYLLSIHGQRPRFAWQIDPFGHSSAVAAMAAAAGYDALVINRIDHSIKSNLKARSALEFLWKPYAPHPYDSATVHDADTPILEEILADSSAFSNSRGSFDPEFENGWGLSLRNTTIFTHILHTHYSAPSGFDFENMGTPYINEWNLEARASELVKMLRSRSSAYRTEHLLVPFGDDFKFRDAELQFSNMDQLVHYINKKAEEVDRRIDELNEQAFANGKPPVDASLELHPDELRFHQFRIQYSTLSDYFDNVFLQARGEPDSHAVIGTSMNQDDRQNQKLSTESPNGEHQYSQRNKPIPFPIFTPQHDLDGGADFFPYADNDDSFWTGYYVTRPVLKSAIRRVTQALRGADALMALARPWVDQWQDASGRILQAVGSTVSETADFWNDVPVDDIGAAFFSRLEVADTGSLRNSDLDKENMDDLDDFASSYFAIDGAMQYASYSWIKAFQRTERARLDAALCLHHDAITGTSKTFVIEDYEHRMEEAATDIANLITDMASFLLGGVHRALPHLIDATPAINEGDVESSSQDILEHIRSHSVRGPAPLSYVPHLIPVPDAATVEYTLLDDSSDSLFDPRHVESIYIHPEVPSHPVVLYNPASWRRKSVIHILVDAAGSQGGKKGLREDESGSSCAQKGYWPMAIVTDDQGHPVLSQWLSVSESRKPFSEMHSTKEATEYAPLFGANLVSSYDGSTPVPNHADLSKDVRYELTFLADLPPLSLSTYFVTVAWKFNSENSHSVDPDLVAHCGTSDPVLLALAAAKSSSAIVSTDSELSTTDKIPSTLPPVSLLVMPENSPETLLPNTVTIENACMRLTVDAKTGLLQSVHRKLYPTEYTSMSKHFDESVVRYVEVPIRQEYAQYETARSGAYLFRPNSGTKTIENSSTIVSVTVTEEMLMDLDGSDSNEVAGGLVQVIRVVGDVVSHTIRLYDTLGWSYAKTNDLPFTEQSALQCSNDPLLEDAYFHLIPTVTAEINNEVVLTLDIDIETRVTGKGEGVLISSTQSNSPASLFEPDVRDESEKGTIYTNLRDSIPRNAQSLYESRDVPMFPWIDWSVLPHEICIESSDQSSLPEPDADKSNILLDEAMLLLSPFPHGWYTGDGVGLLRRVPAPERHRPATASHHYYPLNGVTRVSGWVTNPHSFAGAYGNEGEEPSTAEDAAPRIPPVASVELYVQQPLGVTAKETRRSISSSESIVGTRLEVMMHRYLRMDDGRGMGEGVHDRDSISPHIRVAVHAQWPELRSLASVVANGGALINTQPDAEASEAHERRNHNCDTDGLKKALITLRKNLIAKVMLQPFWTWTWASGVSFHTQPVVVMQADLYSLHEEFLIEQESRSETVTPKGMSHPILDDHFPILHPGMIVASEQPIARLVWQNRYSSRFDGLNSEGVLHVTEVNPDSSNGIHQNDISRAKVEENRFRSRSSSVLSDDSTKTDPIEWREDVLPPWISVESLHVRDGVSDETVVRIQNFGGPPVVLDLNTLFAGSGFFIAPTNSEHNSATQHYSPQIIRLPHHAPSTLTGHFAQSRTLTLNKPEHFLLPAHNDDDTTTTSHPHRVQIYELEDQLTGDFPLAEGNLHDIVQRKPDHILKQLSKYMADESYFQKEENTVDSSADKQNTDEEGVFISDAALEKEQAVNEEAPTEKEDLMKKTKGASDSSYKLGNSKRDNAQFSRTAENLKIPGPEFLKNRKKPGHFPGVSGRKLSLVEDPEISIPMATGAILPSTMLSIGNAQMYGFRPASIRTFTLHFIPLLPDLNGGSSAPDRLNHIFPAFAPTAALQVISTDTTTEHVELSTDSQERDILQPVVQGTSEDSGTLGDKHAVGGDKKVYRHTNTLVDGEFTLDEVVQMRRDMWLDLLDHVKPFLADSEYENIIEQLRKSESGIPPAESARLVISLSRQSQRKHDQPIPEKLGDAVSRVLDKYNIKKAAEKESIADEDNAEDFDERLEQLAAYYELLSNSKEIDTTSNTIDVNWMLLLLLLSCLPSIYCIFIRRRIESSKSRHSILPQTRLDLYPSYYAYQSRRSAHNSSFFSAFLGLFTSEGIKNH